MDCTKVKFATEHDALEHMQRIQAKSARLHVPVRVYRCPQGNHWHLTSKKSPAEKRKALEQKITMLEAEVKKLQDKNKELLQANAGLEAARQKLLVPDSRAIRVLVRADERVKEMQKQLASHIHNNKKLREDNKSLCTTIMQLREGNKQNEAVTLSVVEGSEIASVVPPSQ